MKLSLTQRLAIGALYVGTPIAEAIGRLSGAAETFTAQYRGRKSPKLGAVQLEQGVARDVDVQSTPAVRPYLEGKPVFEAGDPYLRDVYPEEVSR